MDFIITAADEISENGDALLADLEYQANSGMESLFAGAIPVRVHIFETEPGWKPIAREEEQQ